SPSTRMRAAGSPKPGIGRPQYSSSANAARFSAATRSRQSTRRGHLRQATTSALSAASFAGASADTLRGRRERRRVDPEQAEREALDHGLQVGRVLGLTEAKLARDQLGDRTDDRERVKLMLEARQDAVLGVGVVLREQHLREARDDLVAAAHRRRP